MDGMICKQSNTFPVATKAPTEKIKEIRRKATVTKIMNQNNFTETITMQHLERGPKKPCEQNYC